MHAECEEPWTAVRGALAGGSAFCALWEACRKLREVIQTAEDRYLKLYACRLEEFTKAGDVRGWYEHPKRRVKVTG